MPGDSTRHKRFSPVSSLLKMKEKRLFHHCDCFGSLFKCLIPIESCVEITLVLKANVDVMVELTCADGSLLLSENYDENLRIRGWQRKYESPDPSTLVGVGVNVDL